MKDKLKTLLVDDEKPARTELRFLIEESFSDSFEIIGEAKNGLEAIEKIKSLNPNIVFLDIKIPGINGLEVAQIVLEKNPDLQIVFVTAYDEYALKAFEINAIDYLVKPIEFTRFKKTIARILNNRELLNNYDNRLEKMLMQMEQFVSPQRETNLPCEEFGKIILIKRNQICYCTVENGIPFVGTINKKIKTLYTLKELENKLGFFRAHRSYLVNLDYVKHVEYSFHSSYTLTLNDNSNTKIPVSRNSSKKLREILEL